MYAGLGGSSVSHRWGIVHKKLLVCPINLPLDKRQFGNKDLSRRVRRERWEVRSRQSNGASRCLGDIWSHALPEASVCKGQKLEPIAVATPGLDWAEMINKLSRSGRRQLDAHHSMPPRAGPCVKHRLQWCWLLLAILCNVARVVADETISVLDLYLWLSAL